MGTGSPTVRSFFVHQGQTSNLVSGFSTIALRAKASALFEGANRLSSSWNTREHLKDLLDPSLLRGACRGISFKLSHG